MKPSGQIRILFTRKASSQAKHFVGEMGWQSDEHPFIDLVPYIDEKEISWLLEQMVRIDEPIALVFSSPGSVYFLSETLGKGAMTLPPFTMIFSVGDKSAEAVKDYLGLTVEKTAHYASQLGPWLKENLAPGYRVVYVCGKKRTHHLSQELSESSLDLKEIFVYDTVQTPCHVTGIYDAICFFSPSAVESFFSMNRINDGTVALAIGNTTKSALEKRGVSLVLVPDIPGEINMLERLRDYQRELNK